MYKRHMMYMMSFVMIMAAFAWSISPAFAGPGTMAGADASATPSGGTFFANSPAGNWVYTSATGSVNPTVSNSGTALRKFVDSLPGLGAGVRTPGTALGANNLGQYLPIAAKDIATYPGSDYYEIGLRDYTMQMHSDLPKPTKLRGYYQKNGTDHTSQYLGPFIIATKNTPVRIKFFNELGANGAGDLFIPMDPTYMGAGMGPDNVNSYTENRATLHLHGGRTPWISDGTPHQWIVPALETSTTYTRGVSQQNVPDMDGGVEPQGVATFYWTNEQSGRLMFYHDHAYGLTRLNVYAGEAAGYLIVDPAEEDSLAAAGVPGNLGTTPDLAHLIPLVIQDKTFVPQDIAVQDAKWTDPRWGSYGDLWFPHVYETNQWPSNPDLSGANNFGRWDYGPWFWPVFPVAIPGLPTMNVSGVPEGFMDTPIVNGTAYPYLDVQPTSYRLRILNACNDRMLNLSLFTADTTSTGYISPTNGYPTEVKMVDAIPHSACTPSVTTNCACNGTNNPVGCFPPTWPTDSRAGGVPDPATAGPAFIQIGTEGGLLPAPVVINPQPVNYDYNRRSIVVLNVLDKGLFMGPAERADVVVDFSQFGGQTVILYNDAPAPVPAFDPRFDYYTGGPDNTWMGGAPSTLPGYGPNTRTIMQFRVAAGTGTAFNLAALNTALPTIYTTSQPAPVVPQTTYPAPYHATANTYSRIQDTSLTFTDLSTATTVTMQMLSKTIQELFTADYGRMNATLGTELPFTTSLIQTTIPLGYIDPATEIVTPDMPQIWKITHNGVDTHAIHFHLFDVQVINRVGWDGAIRPADANELGWKDTVRMNPLEDIVVALRPVQPTVPFRLPDSVRLLDPTMPEGPSPRFTGIDPYTGNPMTVTNDMTNFGWEYVWHCHLLGHEENDMMRPIVAVVIAAPSGLTAGVGVSGIDLAWTDNSHNETGFTISRATDTAFTQNVATFSTGPSNPASAFGGTINVTDVTAVAGTLYYYRVQAFNTYGPASNTANYGSAWSNTASVTVPGTGFIVASPVSLSFGNQTINTVSTAQTVTVFNNSGTSVTFNSISIGGTNLTQFAQTNTCGASLASMATCTVSVTFAPTWVPTNPNMTATLNINVPAPLASKSVALSGTVVQPVLAVAPSLLSFGNQMVSTISTTQTATVSNTGTGPLTITSIVMGGTNFAQFAQTNNCPASLAPGANCTVSVTFKPTSTGAKSAGVIVNVAAPATSKIISLTGTGTSPVLTVTPASLSFGSQAINTLYNAQTVTVSNTGTGSLTITSIAIGGVNQNQFALTNGCTSPLAQGASCTASVRFFPTSTGAKSATLNVSVAAPAVSKSVPLSGTGTQAVLSVAPASLSFGNQLINTVSTAQTVTVSNTGTAAATINSISIGGTNLTQFTQTNNCPASLAVGASCSVSVRFAPNWVPTNPNMTATLNVNAAAPTVSKSVALSGTVVQPVLTLSPSLLSFGTQSVGTTSPVQTSTVSNTGTAPMTITSIVMGGTNFAQFAQTNNCPGTLAAGANCTVSVTFTPSSAGAKSAGVVVNVAAPATSKIISLTGTGQ